MYLCSNMMFGINVCRPAVNMCRLEIRMFLETVGTWTASTGSSRGKRLCNLKSYRFLRHIINAVGNCSWVLATQTLRALPFLGGNDGICMGPKKKKNPLAIIREAQGFKDLHELRESPGDHTWRGFYRNYSSAKPEWRTCLILHPSTPLLLTHTKSSFWVQESIFNRTRIASRLCRSLFTSREDL